MERAYPVEAVWEIGPNYVFLRDIGSGTYGVVCEAVVATTGQHVAIKKFANVYSNPIWCKRILREIELLYTLNHSCIVRPLDLLSRTPTGDVYLVLEYAQSDLCKLGRAPIFLEEQQVKTLMYRILMALNYLHSGGIVHRDIKPGNILVNNDCSLKLCDFSLSRSTSGLKSSKFDCDRAIRFNPLLNVSRDAASGAPVVEPHLPVPIDSILKEKVEEAKKVVQGEQKSQGALDGHEGEAKGFTEVCGRLTVGEQKAIERTVLLSKSKESIPGFKRELTGHVGTRWYRSPEIILLEKIYTTAVDIWSTGCVFAELLGMMKQHNSDHKSRRALFPGHSCFPLSPTHTPTMTIIGCPVSPRDQLQVILEWKGTPNEQQRSFINDRKADLYVAGLPHQDGKRLSDTFAGPDPEALDLLERMLSFNPYYRITAKEALRHKYFVAIRDKTQETELPKPIALLTDTCTGWKSPEELAQIVLGKLLSPKE